MRDQVALIALNRPRRANALTLVGMAALAERFEQAADDPQVRAARRSDRCRSEHPARPAKTFRRQSSARVGSTRGEAPTHRKSRRAKKLGPARWQAPDLIGAGEKSRTPDLRITNALLYQLSYAGDNPQF